MRRTQAGRTLAVSIHFVGVAGLILIFVVGTLRPVNLGALALAMTFIVGIAGGRGEPRRDLQRLSRRPLVLLVGVTYLFGVAARNGTIERIVDATTGLVGDRRALVPWIVFVSAALPTTAGALGSAGVALLAPLALRLAQRYDIDSRLIGLMVLHGAACGNFSPLNVLGAIVYQTVDRTGLDLPVATLFLGNIAYNVVLGVVIYVMFGGLRLARGAPLHSRVAETSHPPPRRAHSHRSGRHLARLDRRRGCGAVLRSEHRLSGRDRRGHRCISRFRATSSGADSRIAWSVVLLICGIVTYVAVLQRFGTVDAIGAASQASAPRCSAPC